MSLVQQLIADFTTLGTDARRKYPNVKKACDLSVQILNAFPPNSDGEQLSSRPDLVDPIIFACQTKNAKVIGPALTALQKLIFSRGIAIRKLPEIVAALQDATHSSPEIQLKILQVLPPLFEKYRFEIYDALLANLLFVCTSMRSSTKTSAVTNTAQATFSQLMNTVFEKVTEEAKLKTSKPAADTPTFTVPVDEGNFIKVYRSAYDAERLFSDLCTLIEHHKPSYLKTNYMSEDDGFEVVESIIKNNKDVFLVHVELSYLLRTRLAPILLRFLQSCNDFTMMVRVSRLIYLMIAKEMEVTKIESEVALSLLTHLLSKEADTAEWKRIFCLEIFSSILQDFDLVQKIYAEYDNNQEEERRMVIRDFLVVCQAIAADSKQRLNTGDIIQPPPDQLSGIASSSSPGSPVKKTQQRLYPGAASGTSGQRIFSISESTVKQRYMDAIDKPDPPAVPETYVLALVSRCSMALSDGICMKSLALASEQSLADGNAEPSAAPTTASPDSSIPSRTPSAVVTFLDKNSFQDNKAKASEYENIHQMTEACWKILLPTYETFLHSTVDDDTFAHLTRSLQKLCHATGILSIVDARATILNFFARSSIELTGQVGYATKNQSFGGSLVGTISSTIGQAVSNMSAHTRRVSEVGGGSNQGHSAPKLYTRNMTSRHTTCFRVLINLAISLGEILGDDWRTIMIVLQWVSYYVDGPTGMNTKDIPPISPYLTNADLTIISNSLTKFTKGLEGQTSDVFLNVCESLVALSREVMSLSSPSKDSLGIDPVKEDKLQPSIYNKVFFINELSDVAEVDPLKFLILRDDSWKCITKYLISLCIDRGLDDETRLLSSHSFDGIVKATSVAGFDDDVASSDDEKYRIYSVTESRVLKGLDDYLTQLASLPVSHELLVMNGEVQLSLQALNTLKTIIDRFGNKIKHQWAVVTAMLNLPFKLISTGDESILREKSISDMVISVLKSVFDTLRVILDDILQSIPSDQIKVIVDSLSNFVSQEYDLNISFNASSYFWLISDYLKDKIDTADADNDSPGDNKSMEDFVTSEKKLDEVVASPPSADSAGEREYYKYLWLYLVRRLANTTSDPRAQVRNASIIAFFNVVDSMAASLPSWLLIYRIALAPVILHIFPDSLNTGNSKHVEKDWTESLINVINGLTKLFTQHLNDLSDPNAVTYCDGFLKYLSKVVNLDPGWVSVNEKVFESYNTVLSTLQGKPVPKVIVDDLYKFWVGVKIVYNLSDDNLYEDSLRSFAGAFPALFKLLGDSLEISMFEQLLLQLNSCIRFPLLIANRKDDAKCTKLQQQVLDDLESLSFTDFKFESILIQELSTIVTLPFSTRDMILKRVGGKAKVPTFKAASHAALQLLKQRLNHIGDPSPYLNNKCLLHVYDALLEPCHLKDQESTLMSGGKNLAMGSLDVLTRMSYKICAYIGKSDSKCAVTLEAQKELWPRVLSVFKSCFISPLQSSPESEAFDLASYEALKEKLVEAFNNSSIDSCSESTKEDLVDSIWITSFLYELDPLSKELLAGDHSDIQSALTTADLGKTFGSTSPIQPVARIRIAKSCLNDLIELATPTSGAIFSTSLDYFISRSRFALEKYLTDSRLLNKRPVPRIQQEEIKLVLSGLIIVLRGVKKADEATRTTSRAKLLALYPTLIGMVSAPPKVRGLKALVGEVFAELS